MEVRGIEHFANKIGQPGRAGDTVGILLPEDAKVKRGDLLVASRIGAQRAAPSSPAKIEAEAKQARRALGIPE